MSNTTDYQRYKKYKNKYLKIKSQQGGLPFKNKKLNNNKDNVKESIDALHFWGNQFTEHAFMLYLMIVSTSTLSQEGLGLHKKWDKYMTKTFESHGIDKNKIVLDDNDFNKINITNFNFTEAYQLIEELKKYKETVKNMLDKDWIGWLYPSFVKHILDELNYAYREIKGEIITDEEKMLFWNQSNAEEAGLTSHMLDPTLKNDANINGANEYYHKVMAKLSSEEKDQMIIMSIKYANELDTMVSGIKKKIHTREIKSIIHPALIDHTDREDKRCLYVLSKIANQNK